MLKAGVRGGEAAAPPQPVLSRDAFRLLVLLEAQKTTSVNVTALERRFRVPPGYGDEDGDDRGRGRVAAHSQGPGPGTYDAPERWPPAAATPSAPPGLGFLSKTKRAASATMNRSKAAPRPTTGSGEARESVLTRPTSAHVGSPGRSFSRAQRWPPAVKRQPRRDSPEASSGDITPVSHESYSSFRPSSALSFRRSTRLAAPSPSPLADAGVPAVSAYEAPRFPDADDLKQAKGFGATTEQRRVMWGPTYTAPSSAVPTAWNSSRHYAKQKKKVEAVATKQRAESTPQLKSSASSPALPTSRSLPSMAGSRESTALDGDPLAWIRQQPNGEHRANFLAAKFGLADLVKQPVAPSAGQRRHDPPSTKCSTASTPCGDDDTTARGDEIGVHMVAAAGGAMPQLQRQQSYSDMREGDDRTASNPDGLTYQHVAQSGHRLTVCCRLPGGMVVTVHTYSRGKLRGLKTAIARRCRQRFASESDFDVFSLGGRLLGNLDATLVDVGLASGTSSSTSSSSSFADSIMVQIVPRQRLSSATGRQDGGQT